MGGTQPRRVPDPVGRESSQGTASPSLHSCVPRLLRVCLLSDWLEVFSGLQAFFVRVADSLSADSPPAALIPFVSLTLSYLSRHSTKAYYALSTPLLGNLITTALTTPSAAVVSLALRSLAIFVVTLPVVIGDHLFGIMAVYGRAVSWEIAHDHMAGESGHPVEGRGGEGELPRFSRYAFELKSMSN